MIRINLLPYRAARAKENIRKQVSIFSLLLVFVTLALWYSILHFNKEIESLETSIEGLNREIATYKAQADRVTEIEKALKVLEQKLGVIEGLKVVRRVPVDLMDSLTRLIVPDRMWITSLSFDGKNANLSGVAFDNRTVADFMTNIEDSEFFNGAELNSIQLQTIRGAKLRQFQLVCSKRPQKTK
ncbi:MAG: PilN domain-containing protein [Desulfamplus sp.]|nr:PilN domain-containing protein [Desulfamplus sp.]